MPGPSERRGDEATYVCGDVHTWYRVMTNILHYENAGYIPGQFEARGKSKVEFWRILVIARQCLLQRFNKGWVIWAYFAVSFHQLRGTLLPAHKNLPNFRAIRVQRVKQHSKEKAFAKEGHQYYSDINLRSRKFFFSLRTSQLVVYARPLRWELSTSQRNAHPHAVVRQCGAAEFIPIYLILTAPSAILTIYKF
ncbi:hypothetical protein B0H19DRAFT_1074440 [Mycena capillaripes]|nr:hypothetical protein B0H19DRAFT_1074440 [Mycena capillaripes]